MSPKQNQKILNFRNYKKYSTSHQKQANLRNREGVKITFARKEKHLMKNQSQKKTNLIRVLKRYVQ